MLNLRYKIQFNHEVLMTLQNIQITILSQILSLSLSLLFSFSLLVDSNSSVKYVQSKQKGEKQKTDLKFNLSRKSPWFTITNNHEKSSGTSSFDKLVFNAWWGNNLISHHSTNYNLKFILVNRNLEIWKIEI